MDDNDTLPPIKLDAKLKAAVRARAAELQMSMADVVRQALLKFFKEV